MAVLGLASSSQAGLLAEIGRLGTNLLTVTNGQDITGQTAELPDAAPGMIGRLPGVRAVQYTATVAGATIIVITHDPAVAARMRRRIEVLDGRIVSDTGPAPASALASAPVTAGRRPAQESRS